MFKNSELAAMPTVELTALMRDRQRCDSSTFEIVAGILAGRHPRSTNKNLSID